MRHVTNYCNVIVPYCTVWQDMVGIRSSPDPSFFAEVGLACETTVLANPTTCLLYEKLMMSVVFRAFFISCKLAHVYEVKILEKPSIAGNKIQA